MSQISIIIPTFNSSRTVRAALESVYVQTFQDWECVVVDGASKDDTLDIVKEYCEKDNRFRYISEKDHGIYDAFNKGWKLAKSPWVHYLGSDDTLTKEGMSLLVPELDVEYAIVTGDVNLIRVDGTTRVLQSEGFTGCHQGVLMQRNVIEKLGGFDENYRILADYDLIVRTSKAGYKAKNVRAVIANFSVGGESQKLSTQWKKMLEGYEINKKNKVKRFPFLYSLYTWALRSCIIIYRTILKKTKKSI